MSETFMEQDFNDYVTEEQETEAKVAALLPKGWYRSVPPIRSEIQKKDDGRRVIRFNAFVQDSAGHKGFVAFNVSPDERKGQDGKPDRMFRLFVTAIGAYRKATSTTGPVPNSTVLNYLAQYPLDLNVIQLPGRGDFEPSNMVASIRPAS